MKHDLVIKVLLVSILVLLAVNLIRPLVSPSVTHATQSVQYKVVHYPEIRGKTTTECTELIQSVLNQQGKAGWELVVFDLAGYHFIFKK